MRTKELLLKEKLTREEKIAHLKKLGLWREFQRELKVCEGDFSYPLALQQVLESQMSWREFLCSSFAFSETSRGHEFWYCVAKDGKKPLNM